MIRRDIIILENSKLVSVHSFFPYQFITLHSLGRPGQWGSLAFKKKEFLIFGNMPLLVTCIVGDLHSIYNDLNTHGLRK